MFKKFLLILVIGTFIFSFTGCKEKKDFGSDIIGFKYNEGSGMGSYYEYEIKLEKNKYIFIAKGYNGVDLDIEKEISKKQVEKLSKIIDDNDIKSWDGFDKSDKNILDGHGFSLSVSYKSGETLSAHGYMKYPKNYGKASDKLDRYLLSLTKE